MDNNNINFSAFSIIELMVVVMIIGILSTIAIPSYSSYRIKALVAEGLGVLENLKQKSVDFYNQNAAPPSNITDINISASAYNTPNINGVNITSAGVLQVIFSDKVPCATSSGPCTGATLNLIPSFPVSGASNSTSIISWQCGSQSIISAYLPSGCIPNTGPN